MKSGDLILNDKLNSLLDNLKKEVDKKDLQSVLASLEDDSYYEKTPNKAALQILIDINTLLKGAPSTVMNYVDDVTLEIQTIKEFQKSARERIFQPTAAPDKLNSNATRVLAAAKTGLPTNEAPGVLPPPLAADTNKKTPDTLKAETTLSQSSKRSYVFSAVIDFTSAIYSRGVTFINQLGGGSRTR